jgi:replication factor C large subunit
MATARREVLPFLAAMTHHCKPRELTVEMAAHYDLDAAAVSFVTGSGETTNKVASIVEDATARRESTMADHSGAFGGHSPDGDDESVRDADADAERDDAEPERDDEAEATDEASDEATDDGQSGLSDFM